MSAVIGNSVLIPRRGLSGASHKNAGRGRYNIEFENSRWKFPRPSQSPALARG